MAISTCRKCGAPILDDFSRDGTWYFLDDQFRAWKCENGEEHEPNLKEITATKKIFVWIGALLHGIAGLVFLVIVGTWSSHQFKQFPIERWVIGTSGFTVWITWMYKLSNWVDEQLNS